MANTTPLVIVNNKLESRKLNHIIRQNDVIIELLKKLDLGGEDKAAVVKATGDLNEESNKFEEAIKTNTKGNKKSK